MKDASNSLFTKVMLVAACAGALAAGWAAGQMTIDRGNGETAGPSNPAQRPAAPPPGPPVTAPKDLPMDERPKTVEIVAAPNNPVAVIATVKGNIMVELLEDYSPNTVANFIYLIEKGHYKGSDFHRIGPYSPGTKDMQNFAQGGRKRGQESFDWVIKNEGVEPGYSLRNDAGTLSMARMGDIHSAGCQFFINVEKGPDEWNSTSQPYAVFARVVKGLENARALRPGDKINDAWIVRRRDHKYVPVVKRTGSNDWAPAE